MKNLIIALGIAVCSFLAYSQDKINPPTLFNSTFYNNHYDTLIIRQIPGFILGYNWGSPGARLNSALKINTHHDYNLGSTNYSDSMYNSILSLSN